jgi:hypothetical protein
MLANLHNEPSTRVLDHDLWLPLPLDLAQEAVDPLMGVVTLLAGRAALCAEPPIA